MIFQKHFFSNEEKTKISQAIANAEKNTSGEIRVHIEHVCKADAVERAVEIFGLLNMHETELRNGVLFYLATQDKKFSIIGDEGINKAVPNDFWEKIKNHLQEKFQQHLFCDGLCEGIEMAGNQLKQNFPYAQSDKNELSNDPSFGNIK